MFSIAHTGERTVKYISYDPLCRFHAPVSGNIIHQQDLGGTIFSVNADAMTSSNLAILNQRTVTIINSTDCALCAIARLFVSVAFGVRCAVSQPFVRASSLYVSFAWARNARLMLCLLKPDC